MVNSKRGFGTSIL